jgi:phosphatidylinositol 3-kinase
LRPDEALTTSTSTAAAVFEQGAAKWSETLFFPVKYRDLSAGARLEIKAGGTLRTRTRTKIEA